MKNTTIKGENIKMGKAYANRKNNYKDNNDFFPTPYGLTEELISTGELNGYKNILEPAVGNGAISTILKKHNFNVVERDIISGNDFLKDNYKNEKYDAIITNPPFKLWDKFILKAKEIDCDKIIFIGRTNYFGSHSRNINKIWEGLSDVYIFDRQVKYEEQLRADNKITCGCLITGWFIWKKNYKDFPKLHIIDVDKWIYKKGREKK